MHLKTLRRVLRALIICILALALVWLFVRWRGLVLFPDQIDPQQWEIWGVDVSSYQGEVDWDLLRRQGVDFAFIKATEGSGLTDPCFARNRAGAEAAGVIAGAYHFFSYDSPGATQAANFLAAAPPRTGVLPPVIDVEFYGQYLEHPKAAEEVWPILDELVAALTEAWGRPPILYVTARSYALYIGDRYPQCPVWASMPLAAPVWTDWTFWQYSHTARMAGYSGVEGRIDLNVFRGDREDLDKLIIR